MDNFIRRSLLEEALPILDDDDEQDKKQKPAKEMPVSSRHGGRKTASVKLISKYKEKEDASSTQKQTGLQKTN